MFHLLTNYMGEGKIMETNLVQATKPQAVSFSSQILKNNSTAFLGHVHKPEGGCQGCKGCGACGKKTGEGKALDIRV